MSVPLRSFHSFRNVFPSLRHSEIEAIKVLRINFLKNHSETWWVIVLSFHVGNFHGILGIHPIKSFSGDKLSRFCQNIEFSFHCDNLFLLKKQNQHAKKCNNIHILLQSIDSTRECKTTKLKVFVMWNHLSWNFDSVNKILVQNNTSL